MRRGVTYQEMERYDEALADFTSAIALDPKYTRAMALEADLSVMERYDEALADFTNAIEPLHTQGRLRRGLRSRYRPRPQSRRLIETLSRDGAL